MTEGVNPRTIELDTADGLMACFEARPSTPATRAVIVVQEAFGVNRYIERRDGTVRSVRVRRGGTGVLPSGGRRDRVVRRLLGGAPALRGPDR